MKKSFLVLLLTAILALTGCGAENKNEITSEAQTEETTMEKSDVYSEQEEEMTEKASEQEEETETVNQEETANESKEQIVTKMTVKVGGTSFTATLEENEATAELIRMMKENPITIDMSDYSGFEKVGSLGRSLSTSNEQTTTQAGDIVLYNGNQIVIFYGSNSWSYTRLGKIDDLSGWEAALGSGDVSVTFSID